MRTTLRTPLVLLSCLILAGCVAQPKVITTHALLAEMTDLRDMAEFPYPAHTCKQFSSYDQASASPDNPKTWFANADRGQYLRVEERGDRKEYVMMDADGPGAIVRIWSANPQGTLRIYLDHGETATIEVPMNELLGGKMVGIPEPIAGTRSRGWNSYFPIPYAKHCKVTSDDGDFYYHVNYRTYEPGTKVVTFQPAQLDELSAEIQQVADRLVAPGADEMLPADRVTTSYRIMLHSGQAAAPVAVTGPRAICEFVARVEASDTVQALRQVVLTMTFDDERTVAVPLGDFFGAAPGINPYESLPLGVTEDGQMWSHWFMPFRKSARIELRNLSDQSVEVTGRVATVPYRWTKRSLHFHAKWRVDLATPTRPMQDWNYLTAEGQGVFAGAAFAIANPVKNWWGEGDEKIYVDGETFPSHFGTGTEDYFGYAWCCNVPFTHAYHNQPRCDGPGNYGHTAVNRWHIIDRIPFTKDFRFDMELWHWHADCNVDMSVVSYWYARPGGSDAFEPIMPSDLELTLIEEYIPYRVAGALEGEEMRVIAGTEKAEPQAINGCSNDHHFWLHTGVQPGDKLVLGFDVPQAGKYRVLARFLKAADYGIIQLSINDQKAGEPIDFCNKGIRLTKEIELGVFELTEGENRITAEVVGANEEAVKAYMFGLDYIRLEPAP